MPRLRTSRQKLPSEIAKGAIVVDFVALPPKQLLHYMRLRHCDPQRHAADPTSSWAQIKLTISQWLLGSACLLFSEHFIPCVANVEKERLPLKIHSALISPPPLFYAGLMYTCS